jgi:hypothetical protein
MIENYRTQRVWGRFMQNEVVQRGLQRAGFVPLDFVAAKIDLEPAQSSVVVSWDALAGEAYQVEYSPDLSTWFGSPTGELTSPGSSLSWTDAGPPATTSNPFTVNNRFYRVFQFGTP